MGPGLGTFLISLIFFFFFIFNICTNLRLKITLDVMKFTRSLRMLVLDGTISSQRRKAIRGINVTSEWQQSDQKT